MSAAGPEFPQPEDLPSWKAWQRRRQPTARRLRSAVAPRRARRAQRRRLIHDGGPIRTLIALESFGPTQLSALAAPPAAVSATSATARIPGLAYLVPEGPRPGLPGLEGRCEEPVRPVDDADAHPALSGLDQVLVVGNYLGSGAVAERWAAQRGARLLVVQHGLLARQAPPLPRNAHLLAFTAEDADWWSAGRRDVDTTVTGSQLLWEAARREPGPVTAHDPGIFPGIFLGQLHGAELPRRDFARAAEQYCRATGASYRPHPAETDRLSRLTHRRWERHGMTVDRGTAALTQTSGPVAAVFSTGVLEAACAGRDAWVVHPDPPAWLREFWSRYRLSRWTPQRAEAPTPAPALPETSPARLIAHELFGDQL